MSFVNYLILNCNCKLEKCHERSTQQWKTLPRYFPTVSLQANGGSSDSNPAPRGRPFPLLLTILDTVILFILVFLASIAYVLSEYSVFNGVSTQENILRGAWVAQSVRQLTSAQVMISRFVGSSSASDSMLTGQSLEPASDSVSPSLSVCLSLFLSQK